MAFEDSDGNGTVAPNVSSSSEEWCRQQMANLQIADRRLSALTQIRSHLVDQPNSSDWLTLHEIIQCIDANPQGDSGSKSQQTNVACDILSLCMNQLSISDTDSQQNLGNLLQHPNGSVQLVGINAIQQRLPQINNDPASLDENIILALISCISQPAENVALAAMDILETVLPRLMQHPHIRLKFAESLEESDVVKTRVFDLAVKLAAHFEDDLQNLEFILGKLCELLDTDDVLLQMNVLDMLADLAMTRNGFVYLENKGVYAKIIKYMGLLDGNPWKDVLAPGYFKFFGKVASVHPRRIIEGVPQLIVSLFQIVLDTDLTQLPVALDTLGQLTKTSEGTIILHEKYEQQLRDVLTQLGAGFGNLPTNLKTRTLNCLENMARTETIAPDNHVSSILQVWFSWVTGGNNLNMLLDLCRNPFPEIRVAVVTLLCAICVHRWGTALVAATAGFIEHLLDRRQDFDKEVKQEKYLLIRQLAESGCFDAQTTADLKRYVEEGAFYLTGMVEVAVEAP